MAREDHEEVNRPLLSPIGNFGREMLGPAHGKIGAWRMGDDQVPGLFQDGSNIPGEMLAWNIRFQKVARPGIMPLGAESLPDNSAIFASNQNPSHLLPVLPLDCRKGPFPIHQSAGMDSRPYAAGGYCTRSLRILRGMESMPVPLSITRHKPVEIGPGLLIQDGRIGWFWMVCYSGAVPFFSHRPR